MARASERYLLGGALAAVYVALTALLGPPLWREWELSRASMRVSGTVLTVDPGDHLRTTIRYEVNGKDYTGSTWGGGLAPGDRVDVYYLPEDPSVSIDRMPSTAFTRDLFGAVVLCLSVAALVALVTRQVFGN